MQIDFLATPKFYLLYKKVFFSGGLMKKRIITFFLQALSLSILFSSYAQSDTNYSYKSPKNFFSEKKNTLQTRSVRIEENDCTPCYKTTPNTARTSKPWTFLVYLAANNNLNTFAIQNLTQMTKVGSSDNINIVVQFDGLREGKIKRYYIEQGRARLLEELSPDINSVSGTPQSLYQFIKWGYETFPAYHLAIDLWNHGSGIKDPSIWGKFLMRNRDSLFSINPATGLLSLNRRISEATDDLNDPEDPQVNTEFSIETRNLFADLALTMLDQRGIAFNDKEEVYIDNQQLRLVLENTSKNILSGRKVDIVFMDACHMGMVEIASKFRPFVDYMTGSSEVEPGSGYNYERFLKPSRDSALTPRQFAINATLAYGLEYKNSHDDYTQATVDLNAFADVESHMKNLAETLNKGLLLGQSSRIFDLVRTIRLCSKFTTEFYDPDYIDAGDFLANLSAKSNEVLASFGRSLSAEQSSLRDIKNHSNAALEALQRSIIAEVHGRGLPRSRGLGILMPKRNIHASYEPTTFNKNTRWSTFLKTFLTKLKSSKINAKK